MCVCTANPRRNGYPLSVMPRCPSQDVSNLMEKGLPKFTRFTPTNAYCLCLNIYVSKKTATSMYGILKVFDTNAPVLETVLIQQHPAFLLNLLISENGHHNENLDRLIEGFRYRSRGVRVAGVNIGKG